MNTDSPVHHDEWRKGRVLLVVLFLSIAGLVVVHLARSKSRGRDQLAQTDLPAGNTGSHGPSPVTISGGFAPTNVNIRSLSTSRLVVIGVFLFAWGIFFWPTLYRYDRITVGSASIPIRSHRITGATEVYRGTQWVPEKNSDRPVPPEVLASLNGNADLSPSFVSSGSTLSGDLYNGSSWQISEITIRLAAVAADRSATWTRDFSEELYLRPRSSAHFIISTGPASAPFTWTVVAAKGHILTD
jgi:hypothetical protein